MSVNQVNMLSDETLIGQYSEVFSNEFGTLESTYAHLEVHPNSTVKFVNPVLCHFH